MTAGPSPGKLRRRSVEGAGSASIGCPPTFPRIPPFFRTEGAHEAMGKPAHQKRGKPRPRQMPRRSARFEPQDAETRASLRRWVNLSRRDLPEPKPDLT